MLCHWKKIRIVEAEVCPDHVHMLVGTSESSGIKLYEASERQE